KRPPPPHDIRDFRLVAVHFHRSRPQVVCRCGQFYELCFHHFPFFVICVPDSLWFFAAFAKKLVILCGVEGPCALVRVGTAALGCPSLPRGDSRPRLSLRAQPALLTLVARAP